MIDRSIHPSIDLTDSSYTITIVAQALVTGLEWPGKSSVGGQQHAATPRRPSDFPTTPEYTKEEEGPRTAHRHAIPNHAAAAAAGPSPEIYAMGGPVSTMDAAISFAAAPVLGPPGI